MCAAAPTCLFLTSTMDALAYLGVVLPCYLLEKNRGYAAQLHVEPQEVVSLEDLYLAVPVIVTYMAWDSSVGKLCERRASLQPSMSDTVFSPTKVDDRTSDTRRWTTVLDDAGHDPLWPGSGACRGDVRASLTLSTRCKSGDFHVDGVLESTDLHVTRAVSLFDHYYGRTFKIRHMDGEVLTVKYDGGSRVCVVRGKGLPLDPLTSNERGDLYVFFDLVIPHISPTLLDRLNVRLLMALLFQTHNDDNPTPEVARCGTE